MIPGKSARVIAGPKYQIIGLGDYDQLLLFFHLTFLIGMLFLIG
jgi:hypothetical protein